MDLRRMVGWAMPLVAAFDPATLANRLRMESDICLARKQGRCPGKYHCGDCPWSEGSLGSPRTRG